MQVIQLVQKIASHVQVKYLDLSVSHPNYQMPKQADDVDVIAVLKNLPQEIQDQHLTSLLRNLIFYIYYSGEIALTRNQVVKADYEIELDNIAAEVDWEFCERLDKNNQGKGWWNPGFRILKQELNGSLSVQKKGITVQIQRDRHLRLEEQSAVIGDFVSVYSPSSRIVNQYYMAFGNLVSSFDNSPVFIYFNFSAKGAVAIMKYLTTILNEIKIPFCLDVLYNPSNYGRYDSGNLRINKDSYEVVRQVLQTVYAENKPCFQTQIPIFTKMLAPGLALAEHPEPEYRSHFMETFGMNRCQIVANALLKAHKNGDESPESRMKYILQHFECLGIDLERPYLNPNSEDIYTPLD
jgi:hypothetical protein